MARQKELSKYPTEYGLLFATASKEQVTIPCESKQQADNLRNDLYSYRQVLYADTNSTSLAAQAQNVRMFVRFTDNQWQLIAEPIRVITGDENGSRLR